MNQPPLNPDAVTLINACKELYESKNPGRIWEELPSDAKDFKLNKMRKQVSAYLAAALPEVSNVEELKALPIGSVILDGGGDAGIIEPGAILFAETNPLSPEYVAKHYLPARVLYQPGEQP